MIEDEIDASAQMGAQAAAPAGPPGPPVGAQMSGPLSLLRDIDQSPVKQKLVASMTALCKDMGFLVVAEGIETPAERDCVVSLGCDLLQGFLFARPGRPFPTATWG